MKLGSKVLAGAIALALGSTAAMASTALSTTNYGDIFFNFTSYIPDGSGGQTSTSLLFDTGLAESGTTNGNANPVFNQSSSYSFNLSTLAATSSNLTAFLSGLPQGSSLDYSVIGTFAQGSGSTATFNDYFTTNQTVPAVSKSVEKPAATAIGSFEVTADTITTGATSSSVYLSSSTTAWGANTTEGTVSGQLLGDVTTPYGDNAAVGTALNFYSALGTTLTTYAGQWLLSQNGQSQYILSWNPTSTVPLPAPLLLLLSGIGAMGLMARRGRGTASGSGLSAA
jgi:hypothetical protein